MSPQLRNLNPADGLATPSGRGRLAVTRRRDDIWKRLCASGDTENLPNTLLERCGVLPGIQRLISEQDAIAESHKNPAIAISFSIGRDDFTAFPILKGITFDLSNAGAEDPGSTETATVEAARGLGLPILKRLRQRRMRDPRVWLLEGMWKASTPLERLHFSQPVRYRSASWIPIPRAASQPFTIDEPPTTVNSVVQAVADPLQPKSVSLSMCFEGTVFNAPFVRSPLTDLFRQRISSLNPLVDPTMSETDSPCVLITILHSTSKSGAFQPGSTLLVSRRNGPSLTELGISKKDLTHLSHRPHEEAINFVWRRWLGEQQTIAPLWLALLLKGERNAKERLANTTPFLCRHRALNPRDWRPKTSAVPCST